MAKPRSKIQAARDREQIAKLLLMRWSQVAIAGYLEIAESTVSRDVKRIEKDWRESSIRDFDLDRSRELAALDQLEKEYWQAWQNSLTSKETTIREQLRNAIARTEGEVEAGGGRVKLQTKVEAKEGNVNFLNGVLKCIQERNAILGLKADVNAKAEVLAAEHADEQFGQFFNAIVTSPNIPIEMRHELLDVAISLRDRA